MINSLNNNGISSIFKICNVTEKSVQSYKVTNSDSYDKLSSKPINITTIDFKKDNIDLKTKKEIESNFRTKYGSWDDNKISLYDVSNYSDLFPLELESGQVLAFGNKFGRTKEEQREICYDLVVKTTGGPVRLEVQLGNNFMDTPMDESTFKNTVLKSFIMLAEKLKMDEEISNKSLGGGSSVSKLNYDAASKTINLEELKTAIIDSCNRQIESNYDDEFRKKYKGHLNLDVDPEHVKKVRDKYASIYDIILKMII